MCPRDLHAKNPEECPSECNSDGMCPQPMPCAAPRCLDGTCLQASAGSACGGNEYCSPEEGCLPIPMSGPRDAAVRPADTGTEDGGVDAATEDGVYYAEDFATGDGGWTTGGTRSSWEFGIPQGTRISAARTGTSAWVTNLSGDHNHDEMSWIESPPVDLRAATEDTRVEFYLQHDTETGFDFVWLEVSTDAAFTWRKVLTDDGGDDLYSNFVELAWEGSVASWFRVSAALPNTAGRPDVRLRIVFMSDESEAGEGAAIDDVRILDNTCYNRRLDANEVDVDCGGICDRCEDGSSCSEHAHCISANCDQNRCISCGDGLQNGIETQVDCGGECLCPGGSMCTAAEECASSECAGTCAPVSAFYNEDFETNDGAWRPGGVNASWQHGTPGGTFISAAADGDGAWVTDLFGTYGTDEQSWIESPIIDLRGARADPVLSFSLIYDTEGCCDETWVEVSVDVGRTWQRLRRLGSTNWYNDGRRRTWNGMNTGWETVNTTLSGTAFQPDVRLRIHFLSDDADQREGVGIDNVRIAPRP